MPRSSLHLEHLQNILLGLVLGLSPGGQILPDADILHDLHYHRLGNSHIVWLIQDSIFHGNEWYLSNSASTTNRLQWNWTAL